MVWIKNFTILFAHNKITLSINPIIKIGIVKYFISLITKLLSTFSVKLKNVPNKLTVYKAWNISLS